jgi:hypothetical protein
MISGWQIKQNKCPLPASRFAFGFFGADLVRRSRNALSLSSSRVSVLRAGKNETAVSQAAIRGSIIGVEDRRFPGFQALDRAPVLADADSPVYRTRRERRQVSI